MSKKVTIALRPEHALQYASILHALTEGGPTHEVFQGMFLDLRDKLMKACSDQLTAEEVAHYTKP